MVIVAVAVFASKNQHFVLVQILLVVSIQCSVYSAICNWTYHIHVIRWNIQYWSILLCDCVVNVHSPNPFIFHIFLSLLESISFFIAIFCTFATVNIYKMVNQLSINRHFLRYPFSSHLILKSIHKNGFKLSETIFDLRRSLFAMCICECVYNCHSHHFFSTKFQYIPIQYLCPL